MGDCSPKWVVQMAGMNFQTRSRALRHFFNYFR
ncbi:DUF6783 domain-containing protein [Enterococcus avium]